MIAMIGTGIDIGARNVKVVIVNDRKIVAKSIESSVFDPGVSAQNALGKAVEQCGFTDADITQIIATGINAEMTSPTKIYISTD
jgi:activator of 2-hydroxyglutaryl-CoA dehydratase